jgi:hypothetical protein
VTALATRLCVEHRPEVFLAEVLFHRQLAAGLVTIEAGLTRSGAITLGMGYLFETNYPVAVLVNARTEDPDKVAETCGAMLRLLSRVSLDGWVAALAVPAMDAWVLTDPRLKEALDAHPPIAPNYVARAHRLHELAQAQPFDPTHLRQQNEDFRRMEEFIDKGGSLNGKPRTGPAMRIEWF